MSFFFNFRHNISRCKRKELRYSSPDGSGLDISCSLYKRLVCDEMYCSGYFGKNTVCHRAYL